MSDDERPRTEDGRYVAEITADDVLALFDSPEPLTASEVADELGVVRRTAHAKLQTLADEGQLEKKTVGSRAVVWYRPE